MNFEMQKANLLAENMKGFADFVQKSYNSKSGLILDHDKLYQVKMWIEEYHFSQLAEELARINMFEWDEKYTFLLIERFWKGLRIIDDFVEYHHTDLFILTARIHTLKNLSALFSITN
ncbi:hypothetical protein G3A_06940 [Bacillus sp. 17376]|uniref:Uncharacterized protein n=1 Tax=Mesobacillus boroniphilus JCM 21738 TaxID=1294265 RepID=W4RLR8_9BACI|nr:hypothetical protein [Mesobacillus boroniphilus]ESU33323.1 hypothetical protein G3A_06940 [Bacillus sp. 17376]GAE44833.1 hypothetical protein JCM21738_1580 [Mesobacillus boroniphilus JCM 21738]